MALGICLAVLICILTSAWPSTSSPDQSLRYVRLDPSRDSAQPCGASLRTPCSSISQAISDETVRTVLLLKRSNNAAINRTEDLSGIEDVHIQALDGEWVDVRVSLPFRSSWLLLYNTSNITISNLRVNLSTFEGYAVNIKNSNHIEISKSAFYGIGKNTHAVVVDNSECVTLHGLELRGRTPPELYPKLDEVYFSSALRVRYDTQSSITSCTSIDENYPGTAFGLSVENSQFIGLGFKLRNYVYNRQLPEGRSAGEATAVHIRFSPLSVGHTILFRDVELTNNKSPYDPAITVLFQGGSHDNSFILKRLTAFNMSGYIGGVMFVCFEANGNNVVRLDDSQFRNNTAVLEASVARVVFDGRDSNKPDRLFSKNSVFVNNAAKSILAYMPGTFVFTTFYTGVTRGLRVIPAVFENCVFERNFAVPGSVVYMVMSALQLIDCNIMLNQGIAVYSKSSKLLLSGQVNFSQNTGSDEGGALGLFDNSYLEIDPNASVLFRGNIAEGNGGAIFVDASTSTPSFLQTFEDRLSNIGSTPKACFIDIEGMNVSFKKSDDKPWTSPMREKTVSFIGNTAATGMAMFANSLLQCDDSPLYPQIPPPSVQNETIAIAGNSQIVSGPVWVMFESATCDCLKPLDNTTHIVYRRGCSSSQMANDKDALRLYQSAKDGHLIDFLKESILIWNNRQDVFAFPNLHAFLLPWATSIYYWNSMGYIGSGHYNIYGVNTSLEFNPSVTQSILRLGNITLYPAPGEEFSLSISTVDFLAHSIHAAVRLIAIGDVLLRYSGLQHSQQDVISFQSSQPLQKLAIAGQPGTFGVLEMLVHGQVNPLYFTLMIPFRLRPCHSGYVETETMKNENKTREYIKNFTRSEPIQGGRPDINELVCKCASSSGIEECLPGGYDVLIKKHYWAGDPKGMRSETMNNKTVRVENFTKYEMDLHGEVERFTTGYCYDRFCSQTTSLNNWRLRSTDPCEADLNRDGPLCSLCAEGYALVPFDNYGCHRCPNPKLGAVHFYVALFFIPLSTILLAILLNIGSTATFDTWLFYIQAISFMGPPGISFQYAFTGSYYESTCFDKSLAATGQIARECIVPFFVVAILSLIMRVSRRLPSCTRFIKYFPVVPTIWAAILWGYSYLTYPAFLLLNCMPFNGKYVFYADARMTCFGSNHLFYGLLAIFFIVFIVIPLPFLLLYNRSLPRIKPLADVFLSMVHDDRRWWVAVNLGRRLAINALAVFISDPIARPIVLFTAVELLFLLHLWVQPYRSWLNNLFEAVTLTNLAIYTSLGLPRQTDVIISVAFTLFILANVLTLVMGVYSERLRLKVLWRALMKWSHKWSSRRCNKVTEQELSEPLLSDDNNTNLNLFDDKNQEISERV